jgi:hypothetical protein
MGLGSRPVTRRGRLLAPGADSGGRAGFHQGPGLRLRNCLGLACDAQHRQVRMAGDVDQDLVPMAILDVVPFSRVDAHPGHIGEVGAPEFGALHRHQGVGGSLIDEGWRLDGGEVGDRAAVALDLGGLRRRIAHLAAYEEGARALVVGPI